MGAAESTPAAGVGGLVAARDALIVAANEKEDDDLDVDSVDMLLKKLGPSIARASGAFRIDHAQPSLPCLCPLIRAFPLFP